MPPTAHTVGDEKKNETFEKALMLSKMLFTMYIKTMAMTTPTRAQKYTKQQKVGI